MKLLVILAFAVLLQTSAPPRVYVPVVTVGRYENSVTYAVAQATGTSFVVTPRGCNGTLQYRVFYKNKNYPAGRWTSFATVHRSFNVWAWQASGTSDWYRNNLQVEFRNRGSGALCQINATTIPEQGVMQ